MRTSCGGRGGIKLCLRSCRGQGGGCLREEGMEVEDEIVAVEDEAMGVEEEVVVEVKAIRRVEDCRPLLITNVYPVSRLGTSPKKTQLKAAFNVNYNRLANPKNSVKVYT